MNKKRFILIGSIIVIFMICLYFLNIRFDRLSRYPYNDDYARELIDQYMSDEDIEYLIEYSIAPNTFVDFIASPGFSIYHIDYYNELKNVKKNMSGEQIVYCIEQLIQNDADVSRGITLLQGMPIEDVVDYFKNIGKNNGS